MLAMTWAILVVSFVSNIYGAFDAKDDCIAAAQDLKSQGLKAVCVQIEKAK